MEADKQIRKKADMQAYTYTCRYVRRQTYWLRDRQIRKKADTQA